MSLVFLLTKESLDDTEITVNDDNDISKLHIYKAADRQHEPPSL